MVPGTPAPIIYSRRQDIAQTGHDTEPHAAGGVGAYAMQAGSRQVGLVEAGVLSQSLPF